MKSLAHLAGLSLVLATAGFVSGCSSTASTATYRQPAQDFEVVESSTKRPLTDAEMAEVRASVADYLNREGATEGGDYYLKVFLKPEDADADSEWVTVRFTRYTAQRVSVVASYPYDNYLYSPYYAYDIYPYGYGCVARVSFQYYVDPFYHQHFYYPYWSHGGRKGGGHHKNHDTAHNHGNKPEHPGGGGQGDGRGREKPPGPRYTPQNPPATPLDENNSMPRYTRNKLNPSVPRHEPGVTGTRGGADRRENPESRWRGGRPVDATSSGQMNAGNRPHPSNPPSTTPRYRPVNPTASNPPSGNPPAQWRNRNSKPAPAPGTLHNVPRTADRVAPATSRPTHVARPAPASYHPTSGTVRSAPSHQPAPQRSYTPTSSPAPSRAAPPSGGGGGNDRQNGSNSREALR